MKWGGWGDREGHSLGKTGGNDVKSGGINNVTRTKGTVSLWSRIKEVHGTTGRGIKREGIGGGEKGVMFGATREN